jgi:hypothetical protein
MKNSMTWNILMWYCLFINLFIFHLFYCVLNDLTCSIIPICLSTHFRSYLQHSASTNYAITIHRNLSVIRIHVLRFCVPLLHITGGSCKYYATSSLSMSARYLFVFQKVMLMTPSSSSVSLGPFLTQGIIVSQQHHSHIVIPEVLMNVNRQMCKHCLLQHLFKHETGHLGLEGKIFDLCF